ncbi:protoheme IX farnesyltransferase [Candidatus Saccharibacteria bacterium]|nr:protoheme IX farnesyltransferase [Candidatus Saccharibacteria bacterium]
MKNYYLLTKPGIVYGNALSAVGGFFLGAAGVVDFGVFAAMLFGISLVIASACVFNNYLDQGIDAKMLRTKGRALVSGEVSGTAALVFGTILGVIGFSLLYKYTTYWALYLAAIGWFVYVVLYGVSKRRSVHGTLVGSISGSMPIVVGYTAATNQFDLTAWLLFAIMTAWQMPHFYAISLFRRNDYAQAELPVLAVVKSRLVVKQYIAVYIILFWLACVGLWAVGGAGFVFIGAMSVISLLWARLALQGLRSRTASAQADETWARKVFGQSLRALLVLCVVISVEFVLP